MNKVEVIERVVALGLYATRTEARRYGAGHLRNQLAAAERERAERERAEREAAEREAIERAAAPATAPATVDDRTDECVYCGRCQGQIDPNTGRGVSRIGFDCFWCGSN